MDSERMNEFIELLRTLSVEEQQRFLDFMYGFRYRAECARG